MGLVESRPSGDGPLECLSDRIRRARRLAGISQAVLAVQVGVGPSAVAQWELPTGTTPTIDHLAAIAGCCVVRFEWLATGRGEPRADRAPVSSDGVDVVVIVESEVEALLLRGFRRLSEAKRMALLRLLGDS